MYFSHRLCVTLKNALKHTPLNGRRGLIYATVLVRLCDLVTPLVYILRQKMRYEIHF